MLQTVLTTQPTAACLIIAASEGSAARLAQTLFRHNPTTYERVGATDEFISALQKQTWNLIVCAAGLTEFPASLALALLQERGLTLPFLVLTDHDATAVASNDHEPEEAGELKPEVARAVGLLNAEGAGARADLVLRESERFFRTLVENSSDAIMLVSRTGKILYTWPSVKRVLGYEVTEFVGQSMFDLIHPDDRADCLTQFSELISQNRQTQCLRYRFRRRDGAWRWIESNASNLLDTPDVRAVVINFHDVTERLRVEEARARLAAIIEATPDLVGTADVQGRVLYLNRAGKKVFGQSEDTNLSGNLTTDFQPEWAGRLLRQEAIPAAIRDGVWIGETAILDARQQEIPVSQAIIAHKNAQGAVEFFSTIARDLSERRQAEAERLQLQQQLNEAQKIESIGTLAGGIAHDFNNLLTAIMGNTQLALSRLPRDSPAQSLLKESLRASERAASLTRQLLAFSRRQRLERCVVNLNDTIRDFLRMLQRIIGENIAIRMNIAQDLWPVFADAQQIEQVIMNLAVNARDAMPQGGQLLIETHNVTLSEEFCRIHPAARPGRYGQIVISDTGVGMDSETLRRIFEPFFTTREQGRGTGLGLAVVYGIVKQHDGLIEVRSEPGRGTSITIYLPVVRKEPLQSADERATAPQPGSELILLAEDEPMLRDLAEAVLGELGYRVLLASDGLEAVELYREYQDEISLVLLDVIMPRLGGVEAYERISSFGNAVPVILVTGYSAEIISSDFLARTGATVISKPYDIEALGRRIRDLLDVQSVKSSL
jgi:PAS domain S-box-containing protein